MEPPLGPRQWCGPLPTTFGLLYGASCDGRTWCQAGPIDLNANAAGASLAQRTGSRAGHLEAFPRTALESVPSRSPKTFPGNSGKRTSFFAWRTATSSQDASEAQLVCERKDIEVSTLSDVLNAQQRWAVSRALRVDERGYLGSYVENLFRPLSSAAFSAFQNGSGSELLDRPGAPAKMRALHSSSALAVNFFDYWRGEPGTLLAAMGLRQDADTLQFEVKFPTGLGGTPPNLDVAVRWNDGSWLGVESKYTEWLSPKPNGKAYFKDKYFPCGQGLWSSKGLVQCQQIAEMLQSRQLYYRYLDAAQLLKHALGLVCSGRRFELLYIFCDIPGPESSRHADELADFSARIAGDFPFHMRRYQEVLASLKLMDVDAPEYLEYIESRYGVTP